jgi:xanthosine utilization system XapX-like protein
MRLKIRIVTLVLVGGSFIYVLLDHGSLGSSLTLLGAIIGLLGTYIGEQEGEVEISLKLGRTSVFEVWNSGTQPLKEVKIIAPSIHAALQRDFDDKIPKTLPPEKRFPVLAGITDLRAAQAEFDLSWRSGFLTRRHRKKRPTLG